ncbi:MAG: hypothetical protein HQL63_02955 [Magnetococcales bacterium]|nr:hypothetical protein [Magnetococcales bacterium]
MNGNELLRKLRKYAKANGLDLIHVAGRGSGKGSHSYILLGCRRTAMKYLRSEINQGLLVKMLKDLGLTLDDIQ